MENSETPYEVNPVIEQWRVYEGDIDATKDWLTYIGVKKYVDDVGGRFNLIGRYGGKMYTNYNPKDVSGWSYLMAVELAEQMPEEFAKWWAIWRLTR